MIIRNPRRMFSFFHSALLALIWFSANTNSMFGADSRHGEAIKVLIVDGYSNHDWRRNTPMIREILEETGLFQVSVSTAPNKPESPGWDKWRPRFADYDVVIQTCNDLPGGNNGKTPGPRWPKEVQDDFEKFVAAGGGLFAYHAGNNAFPRWPAYNEMIGMGWREAQFGKAIALDKQGQLRFYEAGAGLKTGHGPRIDTVVHRRGEHPIHRGFPDKWMCAEMEVYFFARGPLKNVEIISYAFDPKTQEYWPAEWAVQYVQGRIYSSTNGHFWGDQLEPPNLKDVAFQTIMPRALQWLAKREVTYPIPTNFPGPDKPSVKPLKSMSSDANALSLFNGKDLTGWCFRRKTDKTATKAGDILEKFDGKTEAGEARRYSAKDGVLTVSFPNEADKLTGQFYTVAEFPKNFVLTLEFRASVNADSGIFIRKPQLQCRDYLVAGPYTELRDSNKTY